MSNVSHRAAPAIDAKRLAALRRSAAARLGGSSPPADSAASSRRAVDALAVLHALASSPQTASDALALLHELQVHQVELDLQAQELQDSRAELESALRQQIALYHFQPAGLFTIDARRVVQEANQTGITLLGVGRDETLGQPLETFFGAESASRFRATITSIDAGLPQASCALRLRDLHGSGRAVLACIGKHPAQSGYLVNLVATGTQQEDRPRNADGTV